jgi:hypothetical protein
MRLRFGLASVIWATIFMIAAQFVASTAFAHSGHSPDHLAVSQSLTPHGTHQTKSMSQPQVLEAENANLSVASSPSGDVPAPAQSGKCTGGCCGNGIGCCGAVIAASLNLLADLGARDSGILSAAHPNSGIDPEALRRPPRTIA